MPLGFSFSPGHGEQGNVPLSPVKRETDGTGGSIKAAAGKSALFAELGDFS